MKNSIQIGNVSVPLVDYAVGASAILGIRDSGKTVTSKGIAEQLLENNVPIIVFDAVGKWRWMKSASEQPNGKAYKIVVAGGRGPDLPLTPHSVPEIVRSALKERIPLIIDLFSKELSKADWRRIVQTAIHIIHYENEGGAVHVFLEEAAEFVPQKVYDGETYAEVEKLVRMGGNASVGITLINQRSQEINKAVLDNCSTALVLGCQVGKNAIEAVEKWIERLDPKTADELTQSLPKLKAGEAWVWTRKSLDRPSREQMPMCRSFHPDRRTPELVLKSVKATDTDEFVTRLSNNIPKVIEEAKANDPAELRKKLAEANRLNKVLQNSKPPPETKEVPALTTEERKLIASGIAGCEKVLAKLETFGNEVRENYKQLNGLLARLQFPARKEPATLSKKAAQTIDWARKNQAKIIISSRNETGSRAVDSSLGKCERTLLGVLARYPDEGCNRKKLILLAGYCWSGSTQNALGKLRSLGFISGGNNDVMRITETGMQQDCPTGVPFVTDLLNYWLTFPHFGKCERELLRAFSEHPKGLDREALLQASGYEWSGSTQNALGALRTAEVIVGRNNDVMRLSDELLEAIQ